MVPKCSFGVARVDVDILLRKQNCNNSSRAALSIRLGCRDTYQRSNLLMTASVLRELDELRRSFGVPSSPYRSPPSKYDKLDHGYNSPPSGRMRSYSTTFSSAEVSTANLREHGSVLSGRTHAFCRMERSWLCLDTSRTSLAWVQPF